MKQFSETIILAAGDGGSPSDPRSEVTELATESISGNHYHTLENFLNFNFNINKSGGR